MCHNHLLFHNILSQVKTISNCHLNIEMQKTNFEIRLPESFHFYSYNAAYFIMCTRLMQTPEKIGTHSTGVVS